LDEIVDMAERRLLEVCISGWTTNDADILGELHRRYVVAPADVVGVLHEPDAILAQFVGELPGEGDELGRGDGAARATRHSGKGCTLPKEGLLAPRDCFILPVTIGHDDIARQLVDRGAVEQACGRTREPLIASIDGPFLLV